MFLIPKGLSHFLWENAPGDFSTMFFVDIVSSKSKVNLSTKSFYNQLISYTESKAVVLLVWVIPSVANSEKQKAKITLLQRMQVFAMSFIFLHEYLLCVLLDL